MIACDHAAKEAGGSCFRQSSVWLKYTSWMEKCFCVQASIRKTSSIYCMLRCLDRRLPPATHIDRHTQNIPQRLVNKMLHGPVSKQLKIKVRNTVAISRDWSGGFDPARATKITPYYYDLIHNWCIRTSDIN